MDHEQEREWSPANREAQFSKVLRIPAILDTLVEARRRSLQDVAQALSEVTRRFRSYKLESGEFDQLRLNKPRFDLMVGARGEISSGPVDPACEYSCCFFCCSVPASCGALGGYSLPAVLQDKRSTMSNSPCRLPKSSTNCPSM